VEGDSEDDDNAALVIAMMIRTTMTILRMLTTKWRAKRSDEDLWLRILSHMIYVMIESMLLFLNILGQASHFVGSLSKTPPRNECLPPITYDS
jgi:hypothetical protein